ncbi:MAG: cell division protein FtsZ [Chitinophagales bacterium]|nr:cell division protein FtsZ [Chitinophagales bacterium]
MNLQFDLPKEQSSIIKVIGVGGGGSNAVNHMFEMGIRGVNYVVCNTDQQALDLSPVPNKIQLGPEITQGLGAGSKPEVGEQATIESTQVIQNLLSKNTKMVFVTAGMGGGTGTGGAPVVAKIAREMGILTVGIVTTPFSFEGRRKLLQADEGIKKLKDEVDSILVISNDKIREIYGNLSQSEAFSRADDVLTMAAKSISEIITVPGEINVDFADVHYVMKSSGVAIMGVAKAEGNDRALRAVTDAINSPLLNNNNITGASKILINISSGSKQVTIDEITEINNYVQDAAGNDTDIIFGTCIDDSLGENVSVTIIATGFDDAIQQPVKQVRQVINLEEAKKEEPKLDNLNDAADDMKLVEKPSNPHVGNNANSISSSYTFDLFETQKEEATPQQPNNEEVFHLGEEVHDEKTPEQVDDSFQFTLKNVEEETVENTYSFYTNNERKEQPQAKTEKVQNETYEDRVKKLRDVSYKWDNMNKIKELEDTPAYKRKEVKLNDMPHSSENNISNFSIDSFMLDGEQRPEIRKNNGFLNDNVD